MIYNKFLDYQIANLSVPNDINKRAATVELFKADKSLKDISKDMSINKNASIDNVQKIRKKLVFEL